MNIIEKIQKRIAYLKKEQEKETSLYPDINDECIRFLREILRDLQKK